MKNFEELPEFPLESNSRESQEGGPQLTVVFYDHTNPRKPRKITSFVVDTEQEAFKKFKEEQGREYGSKETDGLSSY